MRNSIKYVLLSFVILSALNTPCLASEYLSASCITEENNTRETAKKVAEYIEIIRERQNRGIMVFMDGQSGSGKSTFSHELQKEYEEQNPGRKLHVIHADPITLLPKSIRYPRKEVILRNNKPFTEEENEIFMKFPVFRLLVLLRDYLYSGYDGSSESYTHTLTIQSDLIKRRSYSELQYEAKHIISPKDVVVIEWKYANSPELAHLADLHIRVTIDPKKNEDQFLNRHNGSEAHKKWLQISLKPSWEKYITEVAPKDTMDLIIDPQKGHIYINPLGKIGQAMLAHYRITEFQEKIRKIAADKHKTPRERQKANELIEGLVLKMQESLTPGDMHKLRKQIVSIKQGNLDTQALFDCLSLITILGVTDKVKIPIWENGTIGQHVRSALDNALGSSDNHIDKTILGPIKQTRAKIIQTPNHLVTLALASLMHDNGLILHERGMNSHAINSARICEPELETLLIFKIISEEQMRDIQTLIRVHPYVFRAFKGLATPSYLEQNNIRCQKPTHLLDLLRLLYFGDFLAAGQMYTNREKSTIRTQATVFFTDAKSLAALSEKLNKNPQLRLLFLTGDYVDYLSKGKMREFFEDFENNLFARNPAIIAFNTIPEKHKLKFGNFLKAICIDFSTFHKRMLFRKLSKDCLVKFLYASYLAYTAYMPEDTDFKNAELFLWTGKDTEDELEDIFHNAKLKTIQTANLCFIMDNKNKRLHIYTKNYARQKQLNATALNKLLHSA